MSNLLDNDAVRWGMVASPYGPLLAGCADYGNGNVLTYLGFAGSQEEKGRERAALQRLYRGRKLIESPDIVSKLASKLFSDHTGNPSAPPCALIGPKNQRRVWQYVKSVPQGQTLTYQEVADHLSQTGDPIKATAVGGALKANHLALIIPCHRIIAQNGKLGPYRWGQERKRDILRREGVSL